MRLYNSLTQTIEQFESLQDKLVSMYVCGITPYDTTHVGHAFTYVFFDTLHRVLTYQKNTVLYTQNVTDIDDDILKRAKATNTDWQTLGDSWTNRYLTDMEHLHVIPPTYYVKATDAMNEIIEMVKHLVEKKCAYIVNGTVYFDIPSYPAYGSLSHYSEKEMIELSRERGANPEDPQKKHPLDFILWQRGEEGEPVWDSPFSQGRPGWHIECSAMITQTLGDQIDIHGGGFDLIYPHHESERAQSETASGKTPFVSYWMHTAMVSYGGEKMAKSLGNLVLILDLIKIYPYQSIRFLLLSHHYRTPWEFTMEELDEINSTLIDLQKNIANLPEKTNEQSGLKKKFIDHLENDMDTPGALNELQYAVQNKSPTQEEAKELLKLIGIDLE